MGWGSLFKLLDFLSWPSFTLLFPLYGSFWAVESNSYSRTQQCLSFWVLFALIRIVESTISKLLDWLPFWPYAKGVVCLMLVIPYFDGAYYIYQYLFEPYFSENSRIRNILCLSRESFSEQSNFLDITHTKIDEEESEKHVPCQETCEPSCDNNDNNYRPTGPRKIQKEWSCSLCMVSTTSEKCLKKHLKGNKHKAKQEEIILHELEKRSIDKSSSSSRLKRTTSIILFGSLNQIGRWGEFLNPAARSIILCKWRKPEFGCTKLNTDGSIDRENTGFGGLLRDHKGDPLCAFVSKAYQDDIFLVELWAIWRGLKLALSLGIKVIWVESDSMSVVKTINKEQGCAKAHKCLKDIRTLLKKFDEYRVSHTWRETNRAADYLSKMVLRGSDVVLWPVDFPIGLQTIITDDAQGRIYRRR